MIQITGVAGVPQCRRSRNTKPGLVACPASQIAISGTQPYAIKYYNSVLCYVHYCLQKAIKTYGALFVLHFNRLDFHQRKSTHLIGSSSCPYYLLYVVTLFLILLSSYYYLSIQIVFSV